jgi:hypothetical protein
MRIGAPNLRLSRQDDNAIPEEDELLRRLRIKYTPVTSSVSPGNFPSTLLNDADDPRELLLSCRYLGLFFWNAAFFFKEEYICMRTEVISHPQSLALQSMFRPSLAFLTS